jgi:hypothetical protein
MINALAADYAWKLAPMKRLPWKNENLDFFSLMYIRIMTFPDGEF